MSRSIMYQREVAMMTSTVKEFLAKEGSGGSEPFPGAKNSRKVFSLSFSLMALSLLGVRCSSF